MMDMDSETVQKLVTSALFLLVLTAFRTLAMSLAGRKVPDARKRYHLRRAIAHTHAILTAIVLGVIWFRALRSLATFLGLLSAGLAIALHDTVANLAGWFFILARKPFKVGDRVEIGEVAGDVIDIRPLQFSMVEIRNWIDADQSSGRIIHVPNSKLLREPLANYESGFEYIWHEIPVLITFESDWRAAKAILSEVLQEKTEHLSAGAEQQIRRAAMRYLIFFTHLTPTVYTSVRDSGVLLTLRYIVKPRQRRGSEQEIWEAVLDRFAETDDVRLAYPTTRFVQHGRIPKGSD